MSLTLPFSGTDPGTVGEAAFRITAAVAGTAIAGTANGSDPYGDIPYGVSGQSDVGVGVLGSSRSGTGVQAQTSGTGALAFGVWGSSPYGSGFIGGIDPHTRQHAGVFGTSDQQGIYGYSSAGTGTYGGSVSGYGVRGDTLTGVAVQGHALGSGLAAQFVGKVECKGDHSITGNATVTGNHSVTGTVFVETDIVLSGGDCAEEFEVKSGSDAEPGTVMVVTEDGSIIRCDRAYDKRVVGVVSGAGDYKPAIILDRSQPSDGRVPLGLVGKVYCKVDAQYGPVEIGDWLTTSPTAGYAMKATDSTLAFGAIIGKALRPLRSGQALLPLLIALQ